MKWVPDKTGRFAERPHYDPKELDAECEGIVTAFLGKRYSIVAYPIKTDDLTVLIEQHVSDLDLYADLTAEGDDVEGVTEFLSGAKPRVRIDKRLSEQSWRENRLRTTVTHELGHVKFHSFLWAGAAKQLALLPKAKSAEPPKCKRESILNASQTDWMEWQAGFVSGAVLMPASAVRKLVGAFLTSNGLHAPVGAETPQGLALIEQVQKAFQTSQDAARVRLLKLGLAMDSASAAPSLLP